MDFYGKRLATASSDRSVKIFDMADGTQKEIAKLQGHDGPVWQVAWAHPKIQGNILASCGYDGRVCLWMEGPDGQWQRTVLLEHQPGFNHGSINSVCWAPRAFGLCLAAAASNGLVYVFQLNEKRQFITTAFEAHKPGVNALSWGPAIRTGALLADGAAAGEVSVSSTPVKRLVTGGCDDRVKVWRFTGGKWEQDKFQGDQNLHAGWVRDVAWAPSIGLPSNVIASASEDKTVVMWSEDAKASVWTKKQVLQFKHKVWSVSWSVMGNILAVSHGDNQVSLWKQAIDGRWKSLSSLRDSKAKAGKSTEGKTA